SDVGDKLLSIQSEFEDRIEVMVCDGSDKQMVQDLNERYGLGMVPANKTQKYAHIELLNSDLFDGKFKVLRDGELVHEWLHLQWDLERMTREEAIRRNKLLEDRRCANHLADACLYAHHFSIHHFAREKPSTIREGTPEWFKAQRDAEIARITARRQRERDGFAVFDEYRAEYEAEKAEQD